jgi:hypothetical protein
VIVFALVAAEAVNRGIAGLLWLLWFSEQYRRRWMRVVERHTACELDTDIAGCQM